MRLTNITWNLVGLGTPLLIALLTIPELIQLIGLERFGLLALAWGLMGYAGVFDLGIGRATTQLVAQLRGQNAVQEIPAVIQTATRFTLQTGVMGFLLLLMAAILDVQRLINYSAGLEKELRIALVLLAFVIPIQAMSATYRGVNEAFENFRGISMLRMALGALNFVGPYWVAHFTDDLPWLVTTLLVSRLVALAIYRYLATQCVKRNIAGQIPINSLDKVNIRSKLLSFGGWHTVSSIISPIMVQADRFVIAAVISTASVATYTIPYELVVQSLVIVGAISSVAFPSLSKLMHEESSQWQRIFQRWLIIVFLVMLFVTVTFGLLLPVVLPMWIGANLPAESVLIGQILLVGVFFNSIGVMYFSLLHAKGRSDITARIHLLELPLFLVTLYMLVSQYGLYGAAWAWAGRMFLDAILLKVFCKYA